MGAANRHAGPAALGFRVIPASQAPDAAPTPESGAVRGVEAPMWEPGPRVVGVGAGRRTGRALARTVVPAAVRAAAAAAAGSAADAARERLELLP